MSKKRLYRFEYVFNSNDETIGVVIRYNFEGIGWKTQNYFIFDDSAKMNGLRYFTEQIIRLEALGYKKEYHSRPLFVSDELKWEDGDNTFKEE